VKPLIENMKDELLKDLYLEELGDRMQLDRQWLKSAIGATRAKPAIAESHRELTISKTQNVKEKAGKVVIKNPPKAEWFLLNLALMREEHFKAIWASNIVTEFSH